VNHLNQMQAFVEAVRRGGQAAAARGLGLSRAQVSKLILDLEGRLGVKLLNRDSRNQSLTESGRLYFDKAVEILGLVNVADETVASFQSEPSGLIRLNAPMSFGTIRLAPLLPAFQQRYPRTELHVQLDDHQLDPIVHGFDVTVRIGTLAASSLIARKLCDVRRIQCASPGYLATHGTPERPVDLQHHNCVVFDGTTPSTRQWILQGPGGSETVSLRSTYRANNGEIIREAVVAGLGITSIPEFLVERELAAGKLVRILHAWARPTVAAYALFAPDRMLPRKSRALIDFLVEQLA
jgi:DNA-binding transcriptional LysR family regulator